MKYLLAAMLTSITVANFAAAAEIKVLSAGAVEPGLHAFAQQVKRDLGHDLTILAPRGRVIVIGNRGRVEIDARETMARDADIRGMVLPNTPPAELASLHAALVAGLEDGTLRPVIGKELPLSEAPEAHRAVLEPGAFGKIVLLA